MFSSIVFIWKKTGVVYDQFLPAGKLHSKSRKDSEKVTTPHRPSSSYSPGKETQFKSTTCSWGYGWEDSPEFSVPSTANVATGPSVNVGDVNFELKSCLINMVQTSSFCGMPNEDANAHL